MRKSNTENDLPGFTNYKSHNECNESEQEAISKIRNKDSLIRYQKMHILYEDNHLIAINKKPSEIVQGDKTGDIPLSEKIKEYIKKKYNKKGNVFCGIVHRLDRPVSGVIVFARTSKALGRMNEIFRSREVQKIYWAVVKNKPKEEAGVLTHFLKKNQEKNIVRVFDKPVPHSVRAELEYKLLCGSEKYHLLEIKPQTGRHHQIRVQLSAIGCPIKGDVKYGFARTNDDGSIHLHSRKISFIHPVKKEPLEIMANPPHEKLWNVFMEKISPLLLTGGRN
jgi:23S rRNA pseudouridine1911/1915/1917 synthase